jgi:putative sigma-54 modulation protein
MQIHIIGNGVAVDGAVEAYVRRRIGFALGRFANRVGRVYATLINQNGPKGGRNMICRIRVRLSGHPTVVVEHEDTDLRTAIDCSASRTGRTVARKLDRVLTSQRDVRVGEATRNQP